MAWSLECKTTLQWSWCEGAPPEAKGLAVTVGAELFRCPDVLCSLDSHEQGVDRQRCSYGSSRGRLTSRRQMSSFAALSDGVFLRQVSTALLSLSGCS